MKNKTIILILSTIIAVGFLAFYVQSMSQTQSTIITPLVSTGVTTVETTVSESLFSLREKEFDFGKIKQSGGEVKHEFTVQYNGKTPIKITGVPTSCGCTTAKIEKDILNPGETTIITVEFDPNFHEEPIGKFFKSVIILTEPSTNPPPELKIWAQVDVDLGKGAFKGTPDND